MPNEKKRKREIDGLFDAMNFYQLQSGLIITDDTEEEIMKNDKQIIIIPTRKWLLEI
jgi:predicted AAA+ superfamily ATPase